MSKWNKFKNTPILFFKDMILKRFDKKEKEKIESVKQKKTIEKHNYNQFYPYTHLLHTGENVTGLSHLDLWIPYFQKASIQFIVLVRNYELFQLLKQKYPLEVILFAKDKKSIDNLFSELTQLKACFYPSNTGNNLHLLHYNEIKHIFIGHGDSDKTASAHKYFRVYDENWVAGEAHIDRFKNAGFDFSSLESIKVGRPNLQEIILKSEIPWRTRFQGDINLLYLSTWEGVYEEQNYTSVYMIENIMQRILKQKYINKIDIKLHPRVATRDKSLENVAQSLNKLFENERRLIGTIHSKEKLVNELVSQANCFICDISAVVTECLAANAPIFVYIPKDKEIKLSESNMGYNYYTYTFSNESDFYKIFDEVISNNNDYLKANREKAMEYILGKTETLNNQFIKELNKL